MSAQQIAVPEALDGGRADVVLAALFEVPRIQATQWLKEGLVTWRRTGPRGAPPGAR